MDDLREFTDDMPLDMSVVTVIHVPKKGTPKFSRGKTGKRDMVREFKKGDRLIAVWTGEYGSDAFDLPLEKLAAV